MRVSLLGLLPLAAVLLAPAPGAAGDKPCTHVIERGDTLRGLAHRYALTSRALLDLNPELRDNPNLLREGRTLILCKGGRREQAPKGPGRCAAKVEHEVESGQTLGAIAAKYGVSESDVLARNPELGKHPDRLTVGQIVNVCTHPTRLRGAKACGYRTPLHKHEVVPGEHLAQIAGRYGVRRREIQRLNPKLAQNPGLLSVGQKVLVCPEIAPRSRERIAYEVKSGDTLGGIAKRYDLTVRELERFQRGHLADVNSLREGQRLWVWVDGGVLPGFGGAEDDRGVLKNGVQLPPSRNLTLKWDGSAWGTTTTVRAIQEAVAEYKRKVPDGPKVHVGDLSRRAGGHFPPHVSHQHGRDADIGYVLTSDDRHDEKFHAARASNLDASRTWSLIRAFLATDDVVYVFMDYKIQELLYEHAKKRGVDEDTLDELFQYPRGKHRNHGLIRHEDGHVTHFHVRFRK